MTSTAINKPNQFSYIIQSYLTRHQCEQLVSDNQYLKLWETSHPSLIFFMKEGIKATYDSFIKRNFCIYNGQQRWLQKEALKENRSINATTVLDKVIQARNAIFQSTNTSQEVIPADTLCNFIPEAVVEWVESQNNESLIKGFQKAVEVGDFEIVQRIINSKKLEAITDATLTNQRDIALRVAFKTAASQGYIEILRIFMSSLLFSKIPGYILGEALVEAAKGSYSDVMNEIMANERLRETSNEKLGEAFCQAVQQELVEVVTTMIALPRFRNVPVQGLGWGFKYAAVNGSLNIIRALISSPRFRDILARDILDAFVGAAMIDKIDIVNALIDSNRFQDVPTIILGKVLCFAAQSDQTDLILALISSPRFQDISIDDLVEALVGALFSKKTQAVNLLISLCRYQDPSVVVPKFIEKVLARAIQSGDLQTVNLLSNFFSFLPIEKFEQAIELASQKWQLYIAFSLILSTRFQAIPPERRTSKIRILVTQFEIENLLNDLRARIR